MLSQNELNFFDDLTAAMFRNAKIGIPTLLKISLSWISSKFRSVSDDIKAADIYPGIYIYPNKILCSLFKNRCFGFSSLKRFSISCFKHIVKRNKIMPSGIPYSPYFREFTDYFNRLTELNGSLDKSEQKAFVEICGDRLYMKYFFPSDENDAARKWLTEILQHIDCKILLDSDLDIYHKHFLLTLKICRENIAFLNKKGAMAVTADENTLFSFKNTECRIHKLRTQNGKLRILAEIGSPAFIYINKLEISCQAVVNDSETFDVSLLESCGSYHRSYEKTAKFYYFIFECDENSAEKISFFVDIRGIRSTAECFADKDHFFSSCLNANGYYTENHRITIDNGCLRIAPYRYENFSDSETTIIVNSARALGNERIWLYSDYSSVRADNGAFQFFHDFAKKDGVKRYYIYHNSMPQNNINVPKDNFVKFGSEQHKILFLSAEKIFAAFVDAPDCIFPFDEEQFQDYSSIFRGEIIYLQHGILHAHIPWRYSPVSKTFHADKIVVSSKFEIENFTETYHFPKEFLIPSGMPRYDLIPHKRYNGSKILYAPSWRAYMTEEEIRNFIAKLSEFLNSAELSAFLSKYDLTLDFKPHPMFEKYSEMFDLRNSRVELAENVKAEEYLIFITDFSSYVFDFAYLSIPVVYFFPDYEDFIGGKYQYRKLDLPFEKAFGKLCKNSGDTISELEHIAKNNFLPENNCKNRMENFFLPLDGCCERLYQYCFNN